MAHTIRIKYATDVYVYTQALVAHLVRIILFDSKGASKTVSKFLLEEANWQKKKKNSPYPVDDVAGDGVDKYLGKCTLDICHSQISGENKHLIFVTDKQCVCGEEMTNIWGRWTRWRGYTTETGIHHEKLCKLESK